MTAPSSASIRFRRSTRVDETRVGDRVVLYHRDAGSGIVLNPAGSLVWDSLSAPRSQDDLVIQLAAKFPTIPRARLEGDVAAYVESLLAHSLIDGDS